MTDKNELKKEELEQIAGGYLEDIPGLEAIGPYAYAGGMLSSSENKELPTPKPIT